MASQQTRNLVVLGGALAFAGACAYIPMYSIKKMGGKNLTTQHEALTGSQIQRGAFLNSGSKDAGADPDWDMQAGTYKGRKVQIKG